MLAGGKSNRRRGQHAAAPLVLPEVPWPSGPPAVPASGLLLARSSRAAGVVDLAPSNNARDRVILGPMLDWRGDTPRAVQVTAHVAAYQTNHALPVTVDLVALEFGGSAVIASGASQGGMDVAASTSAIVATAVRAVATVTSVDNQADPIRISWSISIRSQGA